jgi:hypothetical protein
MTMDPRLVRNFLHAFHTGILSHARTAFHARCIQVRVESCHFPPWVKNMYTFSDDVASLIPPTNEEKYLVDHIQRQLCFEVVPYYMKRIRLLRMIHTFSEVRPRTLAEKITRKPNKEIHTFEVHYSLDPILQIHEVMGAPAMLGGFVAQAVG